MNVDVVIAGAGPAGLAAAVELRRLGAGRILVVDREQDPGGVPRHCQHAGFGLRDLRRVMSGPAYARRYAAAAARAGAEIRPGSTVTSWAGDHTVTLTSPAGIDTVHATAVLLATGCRERPRAARLTPGSRVPGIMTTGELQQRVYFGGQRLPGRAVIVGAEHVSFSALVTLAHAGTDVVALVTEQPVQQSYPAFATLARLRWRTPVWTSTAVTRVAGQQQPAGEDGMTGPRLDGVELTDIRTGETRFTPCDVLVFTGDWIPDHELARLGGLAIDPGTRGPSVDTALETSAPLVFAAGNLIHPAETADVAALSGRHAARNIAAALTRSPPPGSPPAPGRVPVTAEPPLSWISPDAVRPPVLPPRGCFLLRVASYRPPGWLEVRQEGRLLARSRSGRLVPARPVRLPGRWAAQVEPGAGPVRVTLA